MASYDGATLKVSELFRMGHSNASVCLWRLHGCVLDFMHLSATDVAQIATSTHFEGCPHLFGHVVHLKLHVCTFACVPLCECVHICVNT